MGERKTRNMTKTTVAKNCRLSLRSVKYFYGGRSRWALSHIAS